jgi:hypothetical protein
MKKALTRSRPLKKPAPKTILDLTAGRTVVARPLEAMAAEAMGSALNVARQQDPWGPAIEKMRDLSEEVRRVMEKERPAKLLFKQEAADFLGVTIRCISNYVADKKLFPARTLGGRPLFRVEDLLKVPRR